MRSHCCGVDTAESQGSQCGSRIIRFGAWGTSPSESAGLGFSLFCFPIWSCRPGVMRGAGRLGGVQLAIAIAVLPVSGHGFCG